MTEKPFDTDECISEGLQSALERHLVEDYLESKGYYKEDLQKLPQEQAKALMKEVCTYASLKLAELEAKSQFRDDIRAPH